MGLRFRKSMQLLPGVRLNFGKTGMSVSAGVPGFRKTIHTSGRVTTSVGIPGTGLYYVDTKNPSRDRQRNNTQQRTDDWDNVQPSYTEEPIYTSPDDFAQEQEDFTHSSHVDATEYETTAYTSPVQKEPWAELIEEPLTEVEQVSTSALKGIHKTSDDSVDWTEVLVSPLAPDESYNQEMWSYYHSMAGKILAGDIDAYLQLIYEVNPLDDLLAFGGGFEFGTDNPRKIEVEFVVNENSLSTAKEQLMATEFNNLLQDYVCSICIRIARDMFALLPISNTVVHAVMDEKTVLSIDFDRATLSKVKFGFIDPSDAMAGFKHNMRFSNENGFEEVEQIL